MDIQKYSWPVTLSLAMQQQIQNMLQVQAQSLPCYVTKVNKQIVTVKFDVIGDGVIFNEVDIPIATFPYLQYPIQVGDKGVTIGISTSLKNISGMGDGTADLNLNGSLTPLFFVPISNINWPEEDKTKVTVSGPGGVLLKTSDGSTSINISSGTIILQTGSSVVTIDNGSVTIKSDSITLDAPTTTVTGNILLGGTINSSEGSSGGTSTIKGNLVADKVAAGNVDLGTHTHNVNGVETGGGSVVSDAPNGG